MGDLMGLPLFEAAEHRRQPAGPAAVYTSGLARHRGLIDELVEAYWSRPRHRRAEHMERHFFGPLADKRSALGIPSVEVCREMNALRRAVLAKARARPGADCGPRGGRAA